MLVVSHFWKDVYSYILSFSKSQKENYFQMEREHFSPHKHIHLFLLMHAPSLHKWHADMLTGTQVNSVGFFWCFFFLIPLVWNRSWGHGKGESIISEFHLTTLNQAPLLRALSPPQNFSSKCLGEPVLWSLIPIPRQSQQPWLQLAKTLTEWLLARHKINTKSVILGCYFKCSYTGWQQLPSEREEDGDRKDDQ